MQKGSIAGNGLVSEWFSTHDSCEISIAGIMTMLKRLSKESGIKCNPHSFRRAICYPQSEVRTIYWHNPGAKWLGVNRCSCEVF